MQSAYASFGKFGLFVEFMLISGFFTHLRNEISSSPNVDISLGETVKLIIFIHSLFLVFFFLMHWLAFFKDINNLRFECLPLAS